MARGKFITTHLRTGDLNGIRTVFICNKICEMIGPHKGMSPCETQEDAPTRKDGEK